MQSQNGGDEPCPFLPVLVLVSQRYHLGSASLEEFTECLPFGPLASPYFGGSISPQGPLQNCGTDHVDGPVLQSLSRTSPSRISSPSIIARRVQAPLEHVLGTSLLFANPYKNVFELTSLSLKHGLWVLAQPG